MGQNKRFSDCLDHGESKNCGPNTVGSIVRAPGYKYLKNCQNFKVTISSFSNRYKPNRSQSVRKSCPETPGSFLKAPWLNVP